MSKLTVGTRVCFRPGSQPYREGFREGVVIALGVPVLEQAARQDERIRALGGRSEEAAATRALLRQQGLPEDWCLPTVWCVGPRAPAGWEITVHESMFEVVAGGPAAVN